MRALVQRVVSASVTVGEETTGAIEQGLVVLLGVTHTDTESIALRLAEKVSNLRVFNDVKGVMNVSASEAQLPLLVVSQFTLYGDTRKGRRPSWLAAAPPEAAEPLVTGFVHALRNLGMTVETGRFRADMQVALINDGPITLMVEIEA